MLNPVQFVFVIIGGLCFLAAMLLFIGLFFYDGISYKKTKKKGKKNDKH